MKFNKAVKAVSTAILYFLIYYAWMMAVMFGVVFSISFDAVMNFDLLTEMGITAENMVDITPELFTAISQKLAEQTLPAYLEFVTQYAVHLTLLAGALAIITYIIIFAVRKKSFAEKIGLRRIGILNGATAFVFGVSLNVFVTVLLSMIPWPESWMSEYEVLSEELIGGTGIIITLMVGIAAPVLEEIIFRGMCYNSLKSGMPMLAAMILSSWGFGMMHAGILWVIYATVIGIVLAWIYEKNNSILAPMLTHIGFNLMGQGISILPEQPDSVYYLMMAASGLLCAVIVFYTVKTSKYKIQYVMPQIAGDDSSADKL